MTKIAEYLCVGQPIVAYDLAETRRTAGDAAVLVAPGDGRASPTPWSLLPTIRKGAGGTQRSRVNGPGR